MSYENLDPSEYHTNPKGDFLRKQDKKIPIFRRGKKVLDDAKMQNYEPINDLGRVHPIAPDAPEEVEGTED